jgi:uncharacterized membrane protein (DUF4010 family)
VSPSFGTWALPDEASAILVALGAGLLIGLERERRMHADEVTASAGIRTFTITALLGVLAALSRSNVILAAAALGVVALTALSYQRSRDVDPGLTSEVALLATFLTGVLAALQPVLAAAAGVLIAALLVMRTPLQSFARSQLSDQELRDAVLLAGAAILVLPILPDHPIDPWQVVNPRLVWKLTVLIMLVDAAGYVAQRLVGAHAGLAISGLLGGFVSSTAVVATMGQRALAEPAVRSSAVSGAALSQIATVVQLSIVLAVSDVVLLGMLRFPLIAMGVVAAAYGAFLVRSTAGVSAPPTSPGRAFRLRTALLFAGAFTLVALVVAGLQMYLGPTWALAGVVLGGFADAHSTAASVGSLSAQQHMTRELAMIAVGLIVTANTVSKIGFAWAGGRGYFLRLVSGLVLMVAAFWVTWWILARP